MIKIREKDGSFLVLEQENLSNEELLRLRNRMNEEIASIKLKLEEHNSFPDEEQNKNWVVSCHKAMRYRNLNLQKIENERALRNLKFKQTDITKLFFSIAKRKLEPEDFNMLLMEAEEALSKKKENINSPTLENLNAQLSNGHLQ